MDQSNLVCGVTRNDFDRKGEALETHEWIKWN